MSHRCPSIHPAVDVEPTTAKPMKLVNMIRLWVALNNVEQAELAEKLGMSASTMSRFLNGHAVPDGTSMARLIAWLLEP